MENLIMVSFLFAAGIVLYGTLKYFVVMSFKDDTPPVPFWLIVIWLLLATLPNHSL